MQRPLALTASDGLLGKTRSSAKETFRDVVLVAAGALPAMLTGNVLIYLVGIPWLAHAMHAPVLSQRVLLAGLYPFIPGDTLKLYLAAAALPATWRFVSPGDDAGADVG